MIFSKLRSGISVEGKNIDAFKTDGKYPSYVYLMAGVHGDEVEGIYVLKYLFEEIRNNQNLQTPLVVIPILNIDGFNEKTRVNSNGVDLNRNLPTKDWNKEYKKDKYFPGKKPLSEPENIYLIELFKEFPPKFVLSFHTWKPLLNYNGDCKHICDFLASYNNYDVSSDIGYPTPGSLGVYGPGELKAPVLTFECPFLSERESLSVIWRENKMGLKALAEGNFLL